MGSIMVPMAKRIAQAESRAMMVNTEQEKLAAKADYLAMMTDVDLSAVEEDEEEHMEGMTDE